MIVRATIRMGFAISAVGCSLLGGCVGNLATSSEPDSRSPEYIHVVHAFIQVCVPNQEVYFEDVRIDLSTIPIAKPLEEVRASNGLPVGKKYSPEVGSNLQGNTETVRRWIVGAGPKSIPRYFLPINEVLNRDGILSAGGGHFSLIDSTVTHQPVFEIEGHRPQDYISLSTAIEVERDGAKELVTYWFKLPRSIPTNQFSNWQEPVSQEDKATRESQKNPTWWDLTHNREMKLHPPSESAPKMRFKLMTIEDHYNENRFWIRAKRAVADKFYRVSGDERNSRHYVPKQGTAVPPC